MRCSGFLLVALVVGATAWPLRAANYAARVVAYDPGSGAGGLTNAVAALGEPSRETTDPQWGTFAVDPFSPPYLNSQVVSLGPSGFLTLQFDKPVLDDPANLYGLDFLVFGNAFFQLNADFTTTSGNLGGTNTGVTLVSVSADGLTFYALNPARAPGLDAWYPTDGSGDFSRPVDPALGVGDFAGDDLAGVQALYQGSGGGAAYDLAWAVDSRGTNVVLHAIRWVRFDQVSGVAQIDAVSAVGRSPALFEDFTAAPDAHGWRAWGDASLFAWDAAASDLEVTWDSSRTNSYFYHPLGTVLGKDDDFALAFDLRLEAIAGGVGPGKPSTFQLAVGLLKLADATRTNFHRGSGADLQTGPRNLLEFDYFPDTGFGATISPTLVSSNTQFATSFNFPIELGTNEWFHVTMRYTASNEVLTTTVTRGVELLPAIQDVRLTAVAGFTDFRLDSVAVCSYSDAGQDPQYGGSILARGSVDNVIVSLPDPPIDRVTGGKVGETWQVGVGARAGWRYVLERSLDLTQWADVADASPTEAGPIELADPRPPAGNAFYQVRAERR